jgi:hypothetical protein
MDLKNQFKKVADDVKGAAENVKDSVNEALHRSTAEAERIRREAAGDTMTPGEKAGSVINETKNTIQAEIDAGKQEARKST